MLAQFIQDDDTLDYTGKKSKVGKPVMSDLREGKLTLPVIHCVNSANPLERKKLKTVVLRKVKTESDMRFLDLMLKKHGSIEHSIRCAKRFVEDAKESLASLKGNREKKELLSFADFLIDRDF